MVHRYSTALSHLILAGTGIYCLNLTGTNNPTFHHATFGIITVNSLIGVWRWGNPDYGDSSDSLYRFTSFLETIFALPCITTTIWLGHGYMWELAYAHTFVSFIPLITYLTDRVDNKLLDLILTVNSLSCGVVSFLEKNFFGVAAAVSFFFNYFTLKNDRGNMDIPAQDLYNYGMCFFAFFALRSLSS